MKALSEGGWKLLSSRIHRFLYQKGFVPQVLDVFVDEAGITLPAKSGWFVFSMYALDLRKIPNLFEKVAGTRHASFKHERLLKEIYSKSDFVEVEKGDVVFEVGAYIGGFTRYAAESASLVVAIDPNSKVSNCLEFNTREFNCVDVIPKPVWSEEKEVELNLSEFPNENSLLTPDVGEKDEKISFTATTISKLAKKRDVEVIDYLKIEAEGVEPEILDSVLKSDVRVRKIAIDTTQEREGESTTADIVEILEKSNYGVKVGSQSKEGWADEIVFGRRINE
jgi:FkbM family methyltransferase